MDKEIGRRAMLKSVIAAAAGLGAGRLADFLPVRSAAGAAPAAAPMPARILGRTGYSARLFGLGAGSGLAQLERRDDALNIINRALDLGVNYINTAHIYAGGETERLVGEAMAGRRDEVFLATKTRSWDYDVAMRHCEESLERLRTDRIDLYQHHQPNNEAHLDAITGENGALKAFRKLKDEGIVSHLGLSVHSSLVALKALQRYDYDCVLLTLNPAGLHMVDTEYVGEFFKTATEKNVGVIAMKVMGGRLQVYRDNVIHRGVSVKQAFDYALSFPISHTVVAISHIGQVDENVETVRRFTQLGAEQMKEIERIAAARPVDE